MNNIEKLNAKLYLTPEEAAQKLGITRRTMDKWRTNGIGPKYIKVGKKMIGYRESDLIEFIDTSVTEPTPI